MIRRRGQREDEPSTDEFAAVSPNGDPGAAPRLRDRGRMRRRLRYLRKARELALRDLGGLVYELYRFGRDRNDLVVEKLKRLDRLDAEAAELEDALGDRRPVHEVREPGIGGVCPHCGELHSSSARFCSECGMNLAADAEWEMEAER